MRIVFIHTKGTPVYGSILEERALGGTESGIVYLAEELHRAGHWVAVLSAVENPPLSEVLYLPLHAMQDLGPVDIAIAVRDWQALLFPIQATRRFLWTGDSYDQLLTVGIGDRRVTEKMDGLLTVSEWHRETLCARSGFPLDKSWCLGNGVRLSYFSGYEERKRRRLIYASTPFRGLNYLASIIRELRPQFPDLELHVFSSFDVYQGAGVDDAARRKFEPVFAELRSTPGVTVHGSIRQRILAREFMKSSVLAYPNTFEETCCITAMEAMAAGCAILTSRLGALPETVSDAGILVDGVPGSPQYLKAFSLELSRLLSDDTLLAELSQRGKIKSKSFDWSTVAARFLQSVEKQYNLK